MSSSTSLDVSSAEIQNLKNEIAQLKAENTRLKAEAAEAVLAALSVRYRFSRANAVQLLRDEAVFGSSALWNYKTPSGQAAVVAQVGGDFIVVLAYWWEDNQEAGDEEFAANSIGTLTELMDLGTHPDGAVEITGVFTAAMPE